MSTPLAAEITAAEKWLAHNVNLGQSRRFSEEYDLTPARAQVLLNVNKSNRKLSKQALKDCVNAIKTGNWCVNGEPIIVSKESTLDDGQHRCLAVLATDTTIPTMICFGTERKNRVTINKGKKKLPADFLHMEGFVDTTALAATAGFWIQYNKYNTIHDTATLRPNADEILVAVQTNPELIESLAFITTVNSKLLGGRAILAFCHYAFSHFAPAGAVNAFFESIILGNNLQPGSPILYARNRLILSKRLKPAEKAELLFRAWNSYRRRETAVRGLPITGNEFPKILP